MMRTLKKSIQCIGIKLSNSIIISIIVLCLLTQLTACDRVCRPAQTIELYFVPFAKTHSHWDRFELAETDGYGRQLIKYTTQQSLSVLSDYNDDKNKSGGVFTYIVCQKSDRSSVYCYEDCCYIYVPSFECDNSEKIEILKQENDWDKPLASDKMVKLDLTETQDMITAEKELFGESFESKMQDVFPNTKSIFSDIMFTSDKQPIYVCREDLSDNNGDSISFGCTYVFAFSDDGTVSYLELTGGADDWREQINTFRSDFQKGQLSGYDSVK